MTARIEQETTVTAGRDDEFVLIWTNNPVHARRLEKDSRVVKVSGSSDPDEIGGQYKIPSDQFDALKGFKRASKPMSPEQRAAAAERLRSAREAKS
jgi:hypothetical protein